MVRGGEGGGRERERERQKDREGAEREMTVMKKSTQGKESRAPEHQRLLRARND